MKGRTSEIAVDHVGRPRSQFPAVIRHRLVVSGFFLVALAMPPAVSAGDPLNLGHRGTGTNTPENPHAENTLESFLYAIDVEGADGIELDVLVALPNGNADPSDELVIMHDESLSRTTTCRSAAPLDDCVMARTVDQIRADCLPKNGAGETRPGEVVPMLREALDAVVRDRGKRLNIEIKNQPPLDADSQGELCSSLDPVAVSSLVSNLLLTEYTPAERALVIFSSFNPAAVALAKHESTLLGTILGGGPKSIDGGLLLLPFAELGSPVVPDPSVQALLARALGLNAIHTSYLETTPALVRFSRSLRLAVRPYTVNERCEMRRLIDLGVDAIITDEPDVLAAEIAEPSSCGGD
jgi:glycerophosphoryl diester phosphodiesterase